MSHTTLVGLEPKLLWKHFDQLLHIPRPSGHEEKVRAHIKQWASERGFAVREDKVGNVCVCVPATPGHEKAATIILQGHMDMVAEKDNATEFDFMRDAIQVSIIGDWVIAEHTTLGADNGIGVAAALAAAEDPSFVHGPLELLFTVDEETALTGASNLDPSILTGRTLINLDSEDDGMLFVGCAGGCTTEIEFPLLRTKLPAGYATLHIEVTGLKGGHSGIAIHENRGNSLKLLARVLHLLQAKGQVLIYSIEGGNKHNAIPREANAVVGVPKALVDFAHTVAEQTTKQALSEIGVIDPNLIIRISNATASGLPADVDSSQRLIDMLLALPHGAAVMSRDIPGMVETSSNLAVARTEEGRVVVTTSTRSSVEIGLRGLLDQGNAVACLAGGTPTEMHGYPGWQPNMASSLLTTCKQVHREVYNADPIVTAVHAGLECGIIGEKLGGQVDMISFGPQQVGVHAPGEKVRIPSVVSFWNYFRKLLERLA